MGPTSMLATPLPRKFNFKLVIVADDEFEALIALSGPEFLHYSFLLSLLSIEISWNTITLLELTPPKLSSHITV